MNRWRNNGSDLIDLRCAHHLTYFLSALEASDIYLNLFGQEGVKTSLNKFLKMKSPLLPENIG